MVKRHPAAGAWVARQPRCQPPPQPPSWEGLRERAGPGWTLNSNPALRPTPRHPGFLVVCFVLRQFYVVQAGLWLGKSLRMMLQSVSCLALKLQLCATVPSFRGALCRLGKRSKSYNTFAPLLWLRKPFCWRCWVLVRSLGTLLAVHHLPVWPGHSSPEVCHFT